MKNSNKTKKGKRERDRVVEEEVEKKKEKISFFLSLFHFPFAHFKEGEKRFFSSLFLSLLHSLFSSSSFPDSTPGGAPLPLRRRLGLERQKSEKQRVALSDTAEGKKEAIASFRASVFRFSVEVLAQERGFSARFLSLSLSPSISPQSCSAPCGRS